MDWEKALDLDQAVLNLEHEAYGDWHRDPWGWPEIRYVVKSDRSLVWSRLDAEHCYAVAKIDVPKENFGTRPAMVLDPLDRLAYQVLVDACSEKFIGRLSSIAYGWRLPRAEYVRGHYAKNQTQHKSYLENLSMLAGSFEAALLTDIVSFFANVPVDLVSDAIFDRAGETLISKRIVGYLEGWSKTPGRGGLPQRSSASAAIANMYLGPLDDVLEHAARRVPKRRHGNVFAAVRWMDDVWLFDKDSGRLRRAQIDLQRAAESLGLNLNSGKTELLEGPAVIERARQVQHSAVDAALNPLPEWNGVEFVKAPNAVPLEELIDRLIAEQELASLTDVKFISKRMRDHNVRYQIDALLEIAPRLPHCAETLARLFRESVPNSHMQDWFISYVKSNWAGFEWSIASFGSALPAHIRARKPVRAYFADIVERGTASLPLFTLACQRLSAWDDQACRAAVRAAVMNTDNPHYRRVAALAALNAGEERRMVRRWLEQADESALTMNYLRSVNFRPPPVSSDYSGRT